MTHMLKHVAGLLAATFLLVTAILNFNSAQAQQESDIAVVVNGDTPVGDLSLSEVRKLFLGERQYWNAKLPVVLLIRAPVAREREVVLRVIYQMTETQFKQYWAARQPRLGKSSPPNIVYSSDLQYELVSAMPGAIAFVDSRNIHHGVRVVRVDGMLPGDKNYPLR